MLIGKQTSITPSEWIERTNKLANQRLTNERFKVFRAKITEKPNKLENKSYKTCHVLLSNSTSQNAENSQRGQRLTVFELSLSVVLEANSLSKERNGQK